MREILFRGKDKDGNWRIGDLIHGYIAIETVDDSIEEWPDSIPASIKEKDCFPVEVVPETVGQFNACDNNFIGDIVRITWSENNTRGYLQSSDMTVNYVEICVVSFHLRSFVYKTKEDKIFSVRNGSSIVVIGNIHDTPELLKH